MSILRPVSPISPINQALLALAVIVMTAVFIEHGSVDVTISSWFYVEQGRWLLSKDQFVFSMLFYKLPKWLLIVFGVYLLATLAWRQFIADTKFIAATNTMADKTMADKTDNSAKSLFGRRDAPIYAPLANFGQSDILYVFAVLALTPLLVATLKSLTHVPCPHELLIFAGDKPYLSLWQDILSQQRAKCFPAAHASSGFGLYGLAFVPALQHKRWRYVILVSAIGWTMGLYKMMIGDHFFSHTLVSMALAWFVASGLSAVFFAKKHDIDF